MRGHAAAFTPDLIRSLFFFAGITVRTGDEGVDHIETDRFHE